MIRVGRTLVGATNPVEAAPGTIRGDFAVATGRFACLGFHLSRTRNLAIFHSQDVGE